MADSIWDTYRIIRFYHPDTGKDNKRMSSGHTLEQAQAHCQDPRSKKEGEYFDGYTKE